ncbi:MAG: SRPBCC family protein [Gemmatimonadetes bacterium]|nr:SRPBCC family protein [Gemmatimonadota bacterium]
MTRIDERVIRAPARVCFRVAADVGRWPEILPHYRRVRFHGRSGAGRDLVEMAAWRPFAGPLRCPTWWVSEMEADARTPLVRYRHVHGITRGMEVRWEFHATADGHTRVRIVHEWSGPAWPLIGRLAATHVIGPHFISAIARRTLAGVAREAERQATVAADLAPAIAPRPSRAPAGPHG